MFEYKVSQQFFFFLFFVDCIIVNKSIMALTYLLLHQYLKRLFDAFLVIAHDFLIYYFHKFTNFKPRFGYFETCQQYYITNCISTFGS